MTRSIRSFWSLTVLSFVIALLTSTAARAAIAIDAKVSKDQGTSLNNVSAPPFSTTSGNELLLAFISTDYSSGSNTTVSSVSGGGLTWVTAVRANGQSGTSEIWRAFASAPLTNATVTATLSQSVASSITVMSFTGVNTSGTNGSGAIGNIKSVSMASGAPAATLVTTQNGSWVFGVGNDFDNAIARTPGTGQSLLHQYLTPGGDTYWVQMQNAPTPLGGTSVTINDTAPTTDRYNLSVVEVLPSSSGGGSTFSISGTVTPSSLGSGTVLTLSGSGTQVTADSSGSYTFSNLANGTYTITPSKTGTSFNPASQTVTVNGLNVTGTNFTVQTYSISGTVSPAGSGTVLTLSGTSTGTATADVSGNYSFTGLLNGSYTVTPSKTGYTFSPANQPVTISSANVTSVNFTATPPPTYSISGTVSPASLGSGTVLTLSGAASATATADSSGNYTFANLLNGTYTLSPSKSGLIFSPSSQMVTINGSSISGTNFSVQTWSISGTITPSTAASGATVALTGAATGTATPDGSGNYSFSGLISGSYTVTPSNSGYSFSPPSQPVTVASANVTGIALPASKAPRRSCPWTYTFQRISRRTAPQSLRPHFPRLPVTNCCWH